MNKLTLTLPAIFMFMLFIMNGFAQTTSDKDLDKLKSDIRNLKSENSRLKLQLASETDTLNRSIEDLKGISTGTGDKVNSFDKEFRTVLTQNKKIHKATNERFLRFRSIIKTSIILAAIGFFILGVLFVLMFFMFRKKHSFIKKELALNEKALNELNVRINELKVEFNRELTEMHEKIIIKIIDTNKTLDAHIIDVKKAYESSDLKIKEQFENEIMVTKKLASDQLSDKTIELKDTLSKQIADMHETISYKIDKTQKTFEDQIASAIAVCEGSDAKLKKQIEKDISVIKEFTEEQFGILKNDLEKCISKTHDENDTRLKALEKTVKDILKKS